MNAFRTDISGKERPRQWYLGAQNDGLFIIDAPPRPSNDDQWHDRPDGPDLAIPIWQLPEKRAREIVEAHNAVVVRAQQAESALKAAQEQLAQAIAGHAPAKAV